MTVCPAGAGTRLLACFGLLVALSVRAAEPPLNTITTLPQGDQVLPVGISIGTDGLPVMAQLVVSGTTSGRKIRVVKCLDAACSASTASEIRSAPTLGALAIKVGADGLPVIAYTRGDDVLANSNTLEVAKCVDAACGVSTTTVVATYTAGVEGLSMTLDSLGFPLITYRLFSAVGSTDGTLKVTKCVNASCTASGTQSIAGTDAARETSVAIAGDGLPVIAYSTQDPPGTVFSLRVAKCTDLACAAAVTLTRIDSMRLSFSAALGADGLLVMMYTATDSLIKAAKCTDTACTGPVTASTVDDGSPGPAAFSGLSIAIGTDGSPVASYLDVGEYDLKVARCADAACTTSTRTVVSREGRVHVAAIAVPADNRPVIGFRVLNGPSAFKVAKCLLASCDQPGVATRFRLYSPPSREHLYTTDYFEYQTLPYCCGFRPEGPIHEIFSQPYTYGGVQSVEYFRLYNPYSFQHHWTADRYEYDFLATVGWVQEGRDGYILPAAAPGTVPLYRLYYNGYGGLHLWTSDANEAAYLPANAGWVSEGIAGYVLPVR